MKRTLIVLSALLASVAIAAPPAGPELAKEVQAESKFTLTANSVVSFGAGTSFVERTLVPGTYFCDHTTFGQAMGATLPRKTCSLTVDPNAVPSAPAQYSQVAKEGASYTLTADTVVRFGSGERWVTATLKAGRHWCDRSEFGAVDPAYGVVKTCERVSTTTTPTTPTTPTPPVVVVPPVVTPTPTDPVATLPADLSTPEKYRAIAATMGTAAGVQYLKGSASSQAAPTTTYPDIGPSYTMMDLSGQRNPPKVFPDGVAGGRGCGFSAEAFCGTYQVGSLIGNPGDYSSSIANVGYVPDTNPEYFPAKRYVGVGSYQVLNIGHGVISYRPECSWTTYINKLLNNCDNDENAARIVGLQSGSPISTINTNDRVVTVVRAYGRGGWNTNSLVLNADGWLYGVGSNTAHNFFKVNVARAGLQVTGLTMSNSGEFAFVTAWDTVNIKGKVIVIAMSDACQWCAGRPLSEWYGNWGNHTREYPGAPGLGNYSGGKVVGEIDLPTGVTAPTSIAVTTGVSKDRQGYQVIDSFWNSNLLSEANRARFYNGDWQTAFARTAVLLVGSKSEKRMVAYDLRPLFQFYRTKYLTGSQGSFDDLMRSAGSAPTQWPYSFDVAPEQRPVVIKTFDLPSEPTDIALSRTGPARAFVGGLDGKVRVFGLGAGYLDQKAATSGKPADIVQLMELDAGPNVTKITYLKEKGMNGPNNIRSSLLLGSDVPEDRYWWTLSRETGQAKLWKFDAGMTSASVFRTISLRPTVRDPITIEDVDNHGAETYMLSVGDYDGRALHSFLYGPQVWWTDGGKSNVCTAARPCNPAGAIVYTGKVNVPGRVHSMGVANIN